MAKQYLMYMIQTSTKSKGKQYTGYGFRYGAKNTYRYDNNHKRVN